MTSMYRRMRMRHGIRWNTGKFSIDWSLVRDCIYALAVAWALMFAFDALIGKANAVEELKVARKVIEIRESQLTRCLNGKSVGTFYDRALKRDVAIACRPATEIDFGGFGK